MLRGFGHLVSLLLGDLRGDAQEARGVRVLGVVVVELVGGEDLSHDAGLEFVVAEDGTFDFVAVDEFFKEDAGVVLQGQFHGAFQFGPVMGLGDADGGTRVGRLDEDGVAEFFGDLVEGLRAGLVFVGRDAVPGRLRHVVGIGHGVREDLVHGHGTRGHVAADEGDARHLEQALDGAVLAVLAVQDRERDVDADVFKAVLPKDRDAVDAAVGRHEGRCAFAGLEPGVFGQSVYIALIEIPLSLFRDAHHVDGVLVRRNVLQNGARGNRRDVVFTGRAAKQDQNVFHKAYFPFYKSTINVFITVYHRGGRSSTKNKVTK